MSFLAPWALWLGAAAAATTVLLHLVARQRPASYLLPTARFIPERQALVSRAASRPRDLPLLLLRALLLLCAGAAFAQPVFTPASRGLARIVLLDESALVADPVAAARRATDRVPGPARTIVIGFDTTVRTRTPADTVERDPARLAPVASITTALVAARRAAGQLAPYADSIELVLVSPVTAREVDAGTWAVRAQWPGAIRIERVGARADTGPLPALERAIPPADVLGPALAHALVRPSPTAVRIRRDGGATAADSAFARAGGTVVAWDSAGGAARAQGVAAGDAVVVAPFARRVVPAGGTVRARWADGAPAAVEQRLGAGCIRSVGLGLPAAGDLALRPAVQHLIRALARGCTEPGGAALADGASLARLAGGPGAAPASALGDGVRPPSRIVPWLLAIALACGLLELALRRRASADEVAA